MRQAVAYAINRPALTKIAGLNAGRPNEQILPPGIPGYRDVDIYPLGGRTSRRRSSCSAGRPARS